MIRSLLGSSLLMPGLLADLLAADDPLAPKQPHFPAKAKRVIFLFMTGGVSHVDSFDPKPKLTADHGKKVHNKFSPGALAVRVQTVRTERHRSFGAVSARRRRASTTCA